MEQSEGVVLTRVRDEIEADIVCGLLRSSGIDCAHRNTAEIDSTLEDFLPVGPQEVLVPAADLEAARELIASAQDSTG